MYKIAVLGDFDSIRGFMSVGLDVFEVTDAKEAAKKLHSLYEGSYAIVYVTDILAEQLQNDIAIYKENTNFAVIPIPSVKGVTGYGVKNVKAAVERAVGSDIIFSQD